MFSLFKESEVMLDDFKDEQPIIHRILTNSIKKDRFSHAYL